MYIPFDIELPPFTRLRTKSLSCIYNNGCLHYIKAGNEQLIDVVYSAVRDDNWGTVPYHITQEKIQQNEADFTVSYTAQFKQDSIFFEARCRIEGKADDSILFEMTGTSDTSFYANRIGLCLHLPANECKGLPLVIINNSGEEKQAIFPVNISPHQPFCQIRQIQWQTVSGKRMQLTCEGDVFEAEDQRNWMDNSYKIYSRPLHLPFPFVVEEGYKMQQKLLMQFSNQRANRQTIKDTEENILFRVPAIGFAAPSEPALLSTEDIKLLQQLPFNHYRAELDFETDWKAVLNVHINNATSLGAPLELIIFFSDNYGSETAAFADIVTPFRKLIKSVLPLHKKHKVTPEFLQQYFYPFIRQKFPEMKIGYGTDAYFAELNRKRPENNLYDFLSFSMNPQVHTSDTCTLLENIGSIQSMLATIRSFSGKPVHISPVTFKKRKNHDATSDKISKNIENTDSRQHTWFGVGWFLLCCFASHDAVQITFFTTTGKSGLLKSSHELSPLYIVLRQLKLFSPIAMKKRKNDIIFKNEEGEQMIFSLDQCFEGVRSG